MAKNQSTGSMPGLSTFKTGASRHNTAPTLGSKTQRRKAELKSYNVAEKTGGRNKK
jgi:hypothetical protein